MKWLFLCILLPSLLSAVALVTASARAQVNTWIGPETGDWSKAANWSLGENPNITFIPVLIDNNSTQDSSVSLQANAVIRDLTLSEGDSLHVLNEAVLFTAGTIENFGQLRLASGVNLIGLIAQGNIVNQASGRVTLESNTLRGQGSILLNQGLLEGSGSISNFSYLLNEGILDANRTNEALHVSAAYGTLENMGTLRASARGHLVLSGSQTTFNNSSPLGQGTIEVWGDSQLSLEQSTVIGGSIVASTTNGAELGRVFIEDGASLVGVDLHAKLTFGLNSALADSTFANYGELYAGNSSTESDIRFAGYNTVSGGGRFTLTDDGGLYGQYSGAFNAPAVLVNLDNTISMSTPGTAEIGDDLRLENYGVVEAVGSVSILRFRLFGQADDQPYLRNHGTYRVSQGAAMSFTGASFQMQYLDNEGGVVEVDASSQLRFESSTGIRGGVLRGPESLSSPLQPQLQSPTLGEVRLEGALRIQDLILAGDLENVGTLASDNIKVSVPIVRIFGGGTLLLEGLDDSATAPNPTLINEDNTIVLGEGASFKELKLINRHVIESNVSANVIMSQSGFPTNNGIVNSGLIQALDGATVTIDNEFYALQNYEFNELGEQVPGTLYASDGSILAVRNVSGGILETAGSGVIQTSGYYFGKPSDPGEMLIRGKVEVQETLLGGNIRNEGELTISGFAGADSFVNFQGTGHTFLEGNITNSSNKVLLVNGPHHSLIGSGAIELEDSILRNQGLLGVQAAESLSIDAERLLLQNLGQLTANENGVLQILQLSNWNNEGLLLAKDSSQIEISYRGGIKNSGTFQIDKSAQMLLVPAQEVLPTGGFANAAGGEIIVNGLLRSDSGAITNQLGGTVSGTGRIALQSESPEERQLINAGSITPASVLDSLTIEADLILTETSLLQFQFDETESGLAYNRLDVLGPVTLGGNLQVALDSSVELSTGDFFLLISASGGIFFEFDSYSLPELDAGKALRLVYGETLVALEVFADPDFNGDGLVDGLDLNHPTLGWQARYGVDLNGANFLDWQRSLTANEPFTAVPEPSAAWLFVSALLCVAAASNRSCAVNASTRTLDFFSD